MLHAEPVYGSNALQSTRDMLVGCKINQAPGSLADSASITVGLGRDWVEFAQTHWRVANQPFDSCRGEMGGTLLVQGTEDSSVRWRQTWNGKYNKQFSTAYATDAGRCQVGR